MTVIRTRTLALRLGLPRQALGSARGQERWYGPSVWPGRGVRDSLVRRLGLRRSRSWSSACSSVRGLVLIVPVVVGCRPAAQSGPITTVDAVGSVAESSPITVWKNVRVSLPDPETIEFEALAAADPSEPRNLIACTMAFDPTANAHRTVIYASFDGGATWERVAVSSRSGFVGDPACVYGRGDTAYAAQLPIYIQPDNENEIEILRSTDRGKTWQVAHRRPFIDREYLSVDRGGGRFGGRVYLYAQANRPFHNKPGTILQLLYSTDGAASFSRPISPPGSDQFTLMTPSTGALLAGGVLVIPFLGVRGDQHYANITWTEDGGTSLARPVDVAERKECGEAGVGIDLAVDETNGPFDGRIYVAYTDSSGGRCQIKLAASTDRGRTWSRPVMVSDTRPRGGQMGGPDSFQPAIAVNTKGVVGVSWYDRREAADDRRQAALRFTASLDGGVSFLPSVRVTDHGPLSDPHPRLYLNAFAGGGGSRSESRRGGAIWTMFYPEGYLDPGDTREMVASADGAFHAFWYDTRTGGSKLYTARIEVEGQAARNGSPELADLDDVSELATIDYVNTRYDAASGVFTVDAMLANTSRVAISGPFKLRTTGLWSSLGPPAIANASNGKTGPGAVWDLTDSIPGGKLGPGEQGKPVRLAFQFLDRIGPALVRGGPAAFNESMFLWLETRVLAGGSTGGTSTRTQR